LYGDNYSGNHIAIFECDLKAPPQLAYIDHSPEMITDAYRMNFKNWKIVDIDNYMDGNHYFSNLKKEQVWESQVKQLITGPAKIYKEDKIQSPLFLRDTLFPEVKVLLERVTSLDTKSNRKMSPLHKRREEMLREAEEKAAKPVEKKMVEEVAQ
jgi:hypothetical protein